ncbi:membrane fusion protein, multidrug efflux system [Roseateles sp. YR242]|uniref:HlyD family secretion protein n=1 Tax=Roseateles sp. YR242 TaxID=1855305 RepID=UPI0008B95941|nr:HlyD family secretion protein [Roseateles sp. YR242]SEL43330.1 membrane fusion protein, multidrug efflux system [Roseateles sp. YR242]
MSASTPAAPAAPSAPPSSPKSNGRRRPVLLVLALAAVVGGAVYGVHWWRVGRFIESTDDAYLKADSVTVAPKVAGYVTDVFVQPNQAVKRGDPLVRLDRRQYEAMLDQAQATIDSRQADIQRAEADILQQQAQLAQARAQAQAAALSLAHAQKEFERYSPLVITGATTEEHLAELRNARDQANSTLAANQAAVASAEGKIKSSQAQVAQSKAQVKAAEAARSQNHLDVDDTVVRAAIDGRVGDSTVRVGQFVQPGTRLMTVVPVQDVYLVANFKETQIGRMRAGQPVALHVDALPDVEIHGEVESFSPGTGAQFALLPSENATGNFTKIVQRVPVRIKVQADTSLRDRLLPGLSVTTEVDTRDGSSRPVGDAAPITSSGAQHG